MNSERENKAVYLSAALYKQIDERAKDTGFTSVEEYITFVMGEVLKDEEEETVAFSKEEEEEVKKRLKALGYLD